MELREIIAKNLSSLRTGAGLTQLQLAEMLNYSDKAVSKWERADSVPDIFMLKRIADYFGVTVDYLLEEKHKVEQSSLTSVNIQSRNRTHAIISFLSAALVWLIATVVFVIVNIAAPDAIFSAWLAFIYAIPTSAIVLLVFNSIWGKKRLNYLIISILVWALLLSVYITGLVFAEANIWLVFILGIPAEIIIILWSVLGHRKKVLDTEVQSDESTSQ